MHKLLFLYNIYTRPSCCGDISILIDEILKHCPEVMSAPPQADSAAALSGSCGSLFSTDASQDFNQPISSQIIIKSERDRDN